MISSIVKLIISGLLLIVISLTILLNKGLYYNPEYKSDENRVYNIEVYQQLSYLKERREAGAGFELHDIYPEGHLFFYALYGIAWANFIQPLNPDSEIFKKGLTEIDIAISETSSDFSKSNFDENTLLKYGAFYNGWNNLLIAKRLKAAYDPELAGIFKAHCTEISIALKKSNSPFLESYFHNSWPADGVILVSSLAIHDELFDPKYEEVLDDWVVKVSEHLDPDGLIPHSSNYLTGNPNKNSRGASQALILSFLPEIDPVFSKNQYDQFKKLFYTTRLGLPGIREYPETRNGYGDIDSGPVIWGIGTAATIVAHKAAKKNGDLKLALGIRNTLEAFGFSSIKDQKKRFLWGKVDIADVFIVWSRSQNYEPFYSNKNWRNGFQIRSLVLITICSIFLFLMWKKNFK